jgi:hypothetical protein
MPRVGEVWARAPRRLRKTIVAVLGGTVVLLGLALIVLPGPFTLPLLVLGFAILGTEFAWAARALERVKEGMERGARAAKGAVRRVRRRDRSVGPTSVRDGDDLE